MHNHVYIRHIEKWFFKTQPETPDFQNEHVICAAFNLCIKTDIKHRLDWAAM